MNRRTLALRKETLAELATEELAAVVGGDSRGCVTYTRTPTGCNCSGMYLSLNMDCPTLVDCRGN